MKSLGIGAFAVLLSMGFAGGKTGGAATCTFAAGTGVDAASPSQVGTLNCQVPDAATGKIVSKAYVVTANWGSDPLTTGAAASVKVDLKLKVVGTIQTFATTAGNPSGPLPGTPKLNDVAGVYNGADLTIQFRYINGAGAKANIPFKVADIESKIQ